MTDHASLSKASADAVEAARQGEQFAVILTAVQAAQIVQAQQPTPPPPVVQQSHAGTAGKWLAVGVGGSMLMVTVAFAAVALAIASASVALVALVVYGIYRDIRSGPRRR
jgi:hypothetical protein